MNCTFLTQCQLDCIKDDIANITDDALLGSAAITYQHLSIPAGGSATYDPTTGTITDPYVDVPTTAIVGIPTDEDAVMARRQLKVTDRKFLIDRVDLVQDAQSKDQILYNGAVYEVAWAKFHQPTGLVVVLAGVLGGAV